MDILSKDTRTLLTDDKVREAIEKLLGTFGASTTTVTVERSNDADSDAPKVTRQVTVRRVA